MGLIPSFTGSAIEYISGNGHISEVPDNTTKVKVRFQDISEIPIKVHFREPGTTDDSNIDLSPGEYSADVEFNITSAKTIDYFVEGGGTVKCWIVSYSGAITTPYTIVVSSLSTDTIRTKKGTTVPLQVQLKWEDGTVVDLTDATVKMILKDSNGDLIINSSCSILEILTGKIQYSWSAGQTDTLDLYSLSFEVTFTSGKYIFPNNEMWLLIIDT